MAGIGRFAKPATNGERTSELSAFMQLAAQLGYLRHDESLSGAEATDLADRALDLARGDHALDPPAALEAAEKGDG